MDASGLPVERSITPYLIGLGLAVALTAISFGLAASGLLPRTATLVHLRFFLHINLSTTPRENLIALAFAALLICIMLGGSFWIMFDLYHRMMV
jgi:cytochrome o ubiquinol oxidase operon protein cyoD